MKLKLIIGSFLFCLSIFWAYFPPPEVKLAPAAYAYSDSLMYDVFNGLLPRSWESHGINQLYDLLQNNLVYYVKWIFVSIAILYLTLYGFLYITAAGDTKNISEQHDNLIWAVIGFAVIGLANLSGSIFAPIQEGNLINTTEFHNKTMMVVVYIEYILGALAVIYMLMGAIRFIMSGGDTKVLDQEKKNFTWWFFGLVIVMIADTFIKVIYNRDTQQFAGEAGTQQFAAEIFGVVNFVLAIMAAVGVLTIVIASIYYVNSWGDKQSTEKALKIIQSTILGFIILSIAYALVYTFAR